LLELFLFQYLQIYILILATYRTCKHELTNSYRNEIQHCNFFLL